MGNVHSLLYCLPKFTLLSFFCHYFLDLIICIEIYQPRQGKNRLIWKIVASCLHDNLLVMNYMPENIQRILIGSFQNFPIKNK